MVCSLLHGNGSNSSHGKQCKPWKRGLEPGIYDSHDGFLGRGTLGEPPNLSEVFFFFSFSLEILADCSTNASIESPALETSSL